MATVEQRVSYIEGKLEALATKEDLALGLSQLETRLLDKMNTHLRWTIGLQIGGYAAVAAIVAATIAVMRAFG